MIQLSMLLVILGLCSVHCLFLSLITPTKTSPSLKSFVVSKCAICCQVGHHHRKQVGIWSCYLVLAFFLGCWLTGLPTVPFFTDPFLARSLCFSGQPQDVRSSVNTSIHVNFMTISCRFIWYDSLLITINKYVKLAFSHLTYYTTAIQFTAYIASCNASLY